MSLADAVARVDIPFNQDYPREKAKAYAEKLSFHLAREVAVGLRRVGFDPVRPLPDGPGERAFQGGLGPKKIDVAHSDERNGLLLAISIKSITKGPKWGKNLTNRFADLCTESVNMHMRFPYSVLGALFAFPAAADGDTTRQRKESTFRRAMRLFATITGRKEYTDAPEKFENVTMMLFQPPVDGAKCWVKLFDAATGGEISEKDYLLRMRQIFKQRNPHLLGEELDLDGDEESEKGE